MKKFYLIFTALFLTSILSGCSEDGNELPSTRVTTDEQYYANQFASDMLEEVYLWNKEIANDIKKLDPNTNTDPIKTVDEIRYKKDGKEVDRWTMLTNDFESFTSSVGGVETTYGYDIQVYRFSNANTDCFAIIRFVYADSPAVKAGLKRGDILLTMNGESITTSNYMDLYYSSTIKLGLGKMEGNTISPNGTEVSLTAVKMYEDPILTNKTFDINGKKVGYLAYSSFDLVTIPKLIEISKGYKAEGVKELILDLRYNGGGYVTTEELMASMYAPADVVNASKIFHTNIYNDIYTEYYKQQGYNTGSYFGTTFKVDKTKYSTKDANIGLTKIYAIISSGTASASEGLLIGLMPYMDIELIGEASHGKYCTGVMLSTADAYKTVPPAVKNWGIYVMMSRFGDCNGNNPSMPDGLQPATKVADDPFDGFLLGDENETMLKVALQRAGKVYDTATKTRSILDLPQHETVFIPRRANFGMHIELPDAEMLKERLQK